MSAKPEKRLLFFIVAVVAFISTGAALSQTVDYAEYRWKSGDQKPIRWCEPTVPPTVEYVEIIGYHVERDETESITFEPIIASMVDASRTDATRSCWGVPIIVGKAGHTILTIKHCAVSPAANTCDGDPLETIDGVENLCCSFSVSVNPATSIVNGLPRAWWTHATLPPPGALEPF